MARGDSTLGRGKLCGILAENRLSQRGMAQILGITDKNFYNKMKKGVFDNDEITQMIQTLDIEDPVAIFFKNTGTYKVPELAEKGMNKENPC